MEELALHILDIAQNSVSAGADRIEITVCYDDAFVTIVIADNGCGMDEDMVKRITDPFTTSRTTRKIGLGIPLFKESCEQCGGEFKIDSRKGIGTTITAALERNSFDRPPLGNMGQTVAALISCNPTLNFVFSFKSDIDEYLLSTDELKQVLGDVPVSNPEVAAFIEKDVNFGIQSVCGEDILL